MGQRFNKFVYDEKTLVIEIPRDKEAKATQYHITSGKKQNWKRLFQDGRAIWSLEVTTVETPAASDSSALQEADTDSAETKPGEVGTVTPVPAGSENVPPPNILALWEMHKRAAPGVRFLEIFWNKPKEEGAPHVVVIVEVNEATGDEITDAKQLKWVSAHKRIIFRHVSKRQAIVGGAALAGAGALGLGGYALDRYLQKRRQTAGMPSDSDLDSLTEDMEM